MPLGDHLKEARNRLFISVGAMLLGAIVGFFYVQDFFDIFSTMVRDNSFGRMSGLNIGSPLGAFDLYFQGALVMGLVLSSPIWIYQIWAYLVPGLTKKERRYALGFFFAAVPLFLGGVVLAFIILPHAIRAMFFFVPSGFSSLLNASEFLQFILRLHLAFGFAFLIPLALVGANFLGFITGKRVARAWRIVVFVCIAFAAIAAPGPDIFPMLALAAPMLLLFCVALLICLANDKRKERRQRATALAPTEVRPLSEI